MTDFDGILGRLERRARQSQAVTWGGMMLFVGGLSVLAAASVLRAFSFPLPRPRLIALGVPCVLTAAGYAMGRLRSVHLPTVLLRADVALGLDARLSTLYQIQHKPAKAPFARRIAARLPDEPLNMRRALPVRLWDVILPTAGVILAAAAVVLGSVPVREEVVDALPVEATVEGIAVDSAPSTARADDPLVEDPQPDGAREVAESSGPSDLADILTEIRPRGSGEIGSADGPSLEDLPSRVRRDTSLEEVLREIQARLALEGGILSPPEVEALKAFESAAPGLLAEGLARVLRAADSEGSLALIADLLADEDLNRQSRNLRLASGEGPLQEDSERYDEEGESPALSGTGSDTQPIGSEVVEPPSSGRTPAFPLFEGAAEHEEDVSVVSVNLPSAIGDEGAYTYYLTKGVPVEPLETSRQSDEAGWSFSYERVASIVSERALPNDVLDTVKAYFERISEGGS